MRVTLTLIQVLRSLEEKDECYGYEIRCDTGILSGTLYPILHRLEEEGYVRVRVEPQDEAPPRRYYRLTNAGRRFIGSVYERIERRSTS